MTKEELISRLEYFLDPQNGIGAALYFAIRTQEGIAIRFADIENTAKLELKDRFLEYINEKFLANEDLHYQNISEADDRKNVVYKYDIADRPDSLNILDEILANELQEYFNFKENKLSEIDGYLITLGNEQNKIALYKKHYSVNLFKRDRFLLFPTNNRLVKIENDVIAIDRNFDFMLIDENLIVLKLSILEKHFGFEDVIRSQAQNTIGVINGNQLLENIEQLTELAKSMPNARKLMKIRNSPVLQVPVTNVINFIRNHPELTGKIGFNADATKINLDTGVSKKLFLKLLNDDYLFSQLTELQYDTHAKDSIIINDGQEE